MTGIASQNKELCKHLMKYALNSNCDGVRIAFNKGENNSLEYRNGELERLESNMENRFFIEIFINGRYGFFSSNRLNKLELEKFVDNAIALVLNLVPDYDRKLPNRQRYFRGEDKLDLFDNQFYNIDIVAKKKVLKELYHEIDINDNKLISLTTSSDDSINFTYLIDSNGLEVEAKRTNFYLYSSIILKSDSDAKIQNYDFDTSSHWNNLIKNGISNKAYKKANAKLNPIKIHSGTYNLITDAKSSEKFINPIMSALMGSSIFQKNSFLIDKLGKLTFSKKLNIMDKPHQARKIGSRYYDGEGVATQNREIISNGIINNYFINTMYSNKLGLEPTISSPSGICIELGNKALNDILREQNEAILVTNYNGGNINLATGDFSYGIEGFYVNKGKIVHPLSEMNVTGDLISLWNSLEEIGNDPNSYSSNQVPSLLFSNQSFSGL